MLQIASEKIIHFDFDEPLLGDFPFYINNEPYVPASLVILPSGEFATLSENTMQYQELVKDIECFFDDKSVIAKDVRLFYSSEEKPQYCFSLIALFQKIYQLEPLFESLNKFSIELIEINKKHKIYIKFFNKQVSEIVYDIDVSVDGVSIDLSIENCFFLNLPKNFNSQSPIRMNIKRTETFSSSPKKMLLIPISYFKITNETAKNKSQSEILGYQVKKQDDQNTTKIKKVCFTFVVIFLMYCVWKITTRDKVINFLPNSFKRFFVSTDHKVQ